MKRLLALFFLILLCSRPIFTQELGQFYDGAAKPRSEVAWIWVSNHLYREPVFAITQIDHSIFRVTPPERLFSARELWAFEVLPGRHILTLTSFEDTGILKAGDYLDTRIDVKAGEDYYVSDQVAFNGAGIQGGVIPSFNPPEKHIKILKRVMLERSLSVDGVVQSWKHPQLVLTLLGGVGTRNFKYRYALFDFKTGQEVRVFYFLSQPDEAAQVNLIQ